MIVIFNVRNRTLRETKENSEEIDLTYRESRLLEVLCNNCMNTWGDISKYIYKIDNKFTRQSLKTIKSRLMKKTKLHIETMYSYGLKLDDLIYIR